MHVCFQNGANLFSPSNHQTIVSIVVQNLFFLLAKIFILELAANLGDLFMSIFGNCPKSRFAKGGLVIDCDKKYGAEEISKASVMFLNLLLFAPNLLCFEVKLLIV